MDLQDVEHVLNSERAASLCLSKGGWEGWLQCELWLYLNLIKHPGESAEREVRYPHRNTYCDLVSNNLWVEIKAYGIFREGDEDRFLDGVANDVAKMDERPAGTNGLVLLAVPLAIGETISAKIAQRGWNGFNLRNLQYASVFYLPFQ